jgi:hypothetical protein
MRVCEINSRASLAKSRKSAQSATFATAPMHKITTGGVFIRLLSLPLLDSRFPQQIELHRCDGATIAKGL